MEVRPLVLSFHLFEEPEPQHGKSSPVQKGLVPSHQNGESDLIEEGLGFGVPILQYRRDFYFPGTARIHREKDLEKVWEKEFIFDLIERFHQAEPQKMVALSWAIPRLHNWIYKTRPGRLLLEVIDGLFQTFTNVIPTQKRQPFFIRVLNRGSTCSQFQKIGPQTITIEMDFASVNRKGLQHIYISNEMGGRQFSLYQDSTGLCLSDSAIEPWAQIRGDWALFYAPHLQFGFKIHIPKGVTAFRGREVIEALDIFWAGIIFRLPKSTESLSFRVEFGTLTELLEEQM